MDIERVKVFAVGHFTDGDGPLTTIVMRSEKEGPNWVFFTKLSKALSRRDQVILADNYNDLVFTENTLIRCLWKDPHEILIEQSLTYDEYLFLNTPLQEQEESLDEDYITLSNDTKE